MNVMTLEKLVPGESGRIVKIHGRGAIRRRLVDMGLTPGVRIEVVKPSPLGDPIEYRLRGYHLSLRRSEARTIEVELCEGLPRSRRHRQPGMDRTSLARCGAGQQVEILRSRGGQKVSQKLDSLGLKPGRVFSIIQNDFPGPVVLADNAGERVVLGKGMARHLQVKPVASPGE